MLLTYCKHIITGINYYYHLHKGSWSKVHLDDEHDGDPDNRADDHEPAEHHGPGGVGVVLIGHHLPLVQTQTQDKLQHKIE